MNLIGVNQCLMNARSIKLSIAGCFEKNARQQASVQDAVSVKRTVSTLIVLCAERLNVVSNASTIVSKA